MPLFMLMAVKTTELRMSEVNTHNINHFKGAYECAVNSVIQARIDVLNAIKELVMSVEGQKIENLKADCYHMTFLMRIRVYANIMSLKVYTTMKRNPHSM